MRGHGCGMSEVKAVEISAVVAGHTRHADRSITVRIRTMTEAPVKLATWLDERKDKEVTVLIADDMEAQAKSYKGQNKGKNQSPSQRLRNGIYGYWNHLREQGETLLEFEEFYDREMKGLIGQYI